MNKEINGIIYKSFQGYEHGRLVTHAEGWAVAYSRNPHGTHNLVMIDDDGKTNQAYRHGNMATLAAVYDFMPEKAYRKVRRFLAERGIGIDWVFCKG